PNKDAGPIVLELHLSGFYSWLSSHWHLLPPLVQRLTTASGTTLSFAAATLACARAIHAIVVCRERNGDGWITLAGAHGWVFGSLADARLEARWLADNFQLPIREFSP